MRPRLCIASLACLPFIAAFYPYLESEPPPTATLVPRALSHEEARGRRSQSITLPLKRVKRTNRYNIIGAASPAQANSMGVDQDGTDFSYFSTFKFGTSSRDYHMLLDSGASNSWIMGSDCTSQACGAHNTLGKRESTSLQITQTPFSITYGTGSVSGVLANDSAQFAGFNIPFTFGFATDVSTEFLSYPMDGIVGLGRADTAQPPNAVNAPTIVDVLPSQKLIKAKLFGIDLSRTSDSGANDGVINFGQPDTSRYDGDLAYVNAMKNDGGFWEIPCHDAGVDGRTLGFTGRTALMDTGTSFILMPPADAAELHALIPGSTQNGETFTVPCAAKQIVQLTFNGITYDISYKDYVGRSNGGDGSTCISNIIGRQTFGNNQWLVGDVFFKNVYTVFDFDGQRVGLGVKKATTASATIPASAATARSTNSAGSAILATSGASLGLTASVTAAGVIPISTMPATRGDSNGATEATNMGLSSPSATDHASGHTNEDSGGGANDTSNVSASIDNTGSRSATGTNGGLSLPAVTATSGGAAASVSALQLSVTILLTGIVTMALI